VNQVSNTGKNALTKYLHYCKNPLLEIVKLLIGSGSNLNPVSDNSEDALNIYVRSCNNPSLEIIKLLIESGSNID